MLKKTWLVLLVAFLGFALVLTGCPNGSGNGPVACPCPTGVCNCGDACACECGDCGLEFCYNCDKYHDAYYEWCFCIECEEDWEDCECDYWFRLMTIVQDGTGGTPVIDAGIRYRGHGFIIGNDFALIRNARPGSRLRVSLYAPDAAPAVTQTWGDCGSVGTGGMAGRDDFRVTFGPPPVYGSFTRYITAVEFYRIEDFAEATFANVNTWGGIEVREVHLMIPRTPIGNQTPIAADFFINANLAQFLEDGAVVGATIAPRFRKSTGAITIRYAGETTVPQTAGMFPVTFDVAASPGWNAATGLAVGTLDIRAARPQDNVLGAFLAVTGFDVSGLDAELEAGTALGNVDTGILTAFANWVGAGVRPVWVLNADDTFSLRIDASDGNNAVRVNLPFAEGDTITISGRTGSVISANIVTLAVGDWNPVAGAAAWSVAASSDFSFSGSLTGEQAGGGFVRIGANPDGTAGAYFYIDSITVSR